MDNDSFTCVFPGPTEVNETNNYARNYELINQLTVYTRLNHAVYRKDMRDFTELRNSKARYISALVNKDFIDGKHIFTFDFTRHRDNINLNVAKYSEYTPLTYAVSSPYPDYRIVKVLLHYGADPTLVNCDREGNHISDPLFLAIENNSKTSKSKPYKLSNHIPEIKEIIRLLVSQDKKPSFVFKGNTRVEHALEKGWEKDVIEILESLDPATHMFNSRKNLLMLNEGLSSQDGEVGPAQQYLRSAFIDREIASFIPSGTPDISASVQPSKKAGTRKYKKSKMKKRSKRTNKRRTKQTTK
jgi:hypothetical protein